MIGIAAGHRHRTFEGINNLKVKDNNDYFQPRDSKLVTT
jgi:hypothetical protein